MAASEGPIPQFEHKHLTQSKASFKESLFEIESLFDEPDREILRNDSLLAFKGPVPYIDWVYGNINSESLQKAKEFYGEKHFKWLVSEHQDPSLLVSSGFSLHEVSYEMGMHVSSCMLPPLPPHIEIEPVHSSQAYERWVQVSAEAWEDLPKAWDQFFKPWVQTGRCIPYIALFDGKPAASALLYTSEKGMSLWAIGTKSAFRKKGLGTALTAACLQDAKKNPHTDWVMLYGSEMGKPVYEKFGFQVLQVIREYASHPPK